MLDQRQFLTQKDRNRHSQSDKFRPVTADVVQTKVSGMNVECVLKKQEDPVMTDWVHVSGGRTEGSLGRLLAQRQAALRECWRRGYSQPTTNFVFRTCRLFLEQLSCHENK
jgi:hypothetical protein